MKELGVRLQTVADMVRTGSRVADIGTDHALLPVHLIKSGRVPFAIASDVKEGPAAAAAHTVKEAGVTALVSVRVGDGLATVQPHEVDDVVVAGMGGETIVQILAAAPWICDARLQFVLQPMSKPEKLREFLYQNGFSILEERVVEDAEHLYSVMLAAFTNDVFDFDDADCLIGKIPHTPLGEIYIQKQRGRILKRLEGLEKSGQSRGEIVKLQNCESRLAVWLSEK